MARVSIPRGLQDRLRKLMSYRKIPEDRVREYVSELRELSEKVIREDELRRVVKIFKTLSDPARIRILKLLAKRRMCVCELTAALGIRQPVISYHLRLLKEAGLVESVKVGKWVFYEVSDRRLLRSINKIIEIA